jgi:Icc-related predicted phosphoesterase
VLLDHRRAWPCGGIVFLGYSATPPTPYYAKDLERLDRPDDPIPSGGGFVWDARRRTVREVSAHEHYRGQKSLQSELDEAPPAPAPWVFVCHAPPYGSALDRLPRMASPIGSRAVRSFIESRRPSCSLHGHIHESPQVSGRYFERIGDTLAINPGQEPTRLHAVLLDASQPARTLRHTVFD